MSQIGGFLLLDNVRILIEIHVMPSSSENFEHEGMINVIFDK